MFTFWKVLASLLLFALFSASARSLDDSQAHGNASTVAERSRGPLNGSPETTSLPQDNDVVHRPSASNSATASSRRTAAKEDYVGFPMPKGAEKSTFRNIDSALVGMRGVGKGRSSGLVLGHGMPKSARFFGMQTVQSECRCLLVTGRWINLIILSSPRHCLLLCSERFLAQLPQ